MDDFEAPQELCAATIFRASQYDPAEYCGEPAEVGSDYCGRHNTDPEDDPRLEYNVEDEWDRAERRAEWE